MRRGPRFLFLVPALAATFVFFALAGSSATAMRFESAGLANARHNGEPGANFSPPVRAGDPFLYAVFVLQADGFATDAVDAEVVLKRGGAVVQMEDVAARPGQRAWSLCKACHVPAAYTVSLVARGAETRELGFVAY
jgi:hypothetical protein